MTGQSRLTRFIEEEAHTLHGTIRFYVLRAGLAPGISSARIAADELLSETVAEAMEHSDRFREDGQPRAWLLGIAANLIKRRQVELAKRNQREPLARDLYSHTEEQLSEDDLFDRLTLISTDDPARQVEQSERLVELMAHLSTSDQEVIELAVLNGLDGRLVAQELGIKPGAARVRLHRALGRLREALLAEMEVGNDD